MIVTKGAERGLYEAGPAPAIGAFVREELVLGVREEVALDGRLALEVDEEEVLSAVRELLALGVRMIVVALRNAWANPHNERRLREHVRARYPVHYLRSVPLQLSSEIVHVADDHARANSALLNGYIHADIANAFYRIEDMMRQRGFRRPLLVVHANGGNARVAKTVALHTLNSGPAVAARGAQEVARLLGLKHVITGDMGGTSFDSALIVEGELPFASRPSVERVVVATPMIEVQAIGAGGGSIAKMAAGRLSVGPESAGSLPGPACYDRGGIEPTVTDADLLLGYIDPQFFLGGRMTLALEKARRAVERRIAKPLGIGVEAAAFAIREAITERMAGMLADRLSASKYKDVEFAFLALGGAGPLHATGIAERLGIRRIVAFPFGSVFSAFGGSTTNIQHLYARALSGEAQRDERAVARITNELEALAREDMRGEGVEWDSVTTQRACDVDGIRLVAQAPTPRYTFQPRALTGAGAPAAKSSRNVYWRANAAQVTPVFDREALVPGHRIDGPALVEGVDTIYPVAPGWRFSVNAYGFFEITHASPS
jgi:N-methylhydantoinase A/acetophenone carboxylase